jgi:hypothetical protein
MEGNNEYMKVAKFCGHMQVTNVGAETLITDARYLTVKVLIKITLFIVL